MTAFGISPRDCVSLASEQAESSCAKEWLFRDERGTWELFARDLLMIEGIEQRAIAKGLGAEELKGEVAVILLSTALDAVLAQSTK